MSAYSVIYRDMQKATQSKIICFFTEPSVTAILRRSLPVATFSQENWPPLFQQVTTESPFPPLNPNVAVGGRSDFHFKCCGRTVLVYSRVSFYDGVTFSNIWS